MTRVGLLVIAVAACGDNIAPEQPAPDAGPPTFAEFEHGKVPRLVAEGGKTLRMPKIRPVFFASGNDSATQAVIEQFLAELATSTYWTATTSEYGVGTLTISPTILTTDAPPTTDVALDALLRRNLDGTHTDWGTLDESTIYSVFLPAGVVLHTSFGDSCQSFGAYHDEAMGLGGKHLVYALMPRCDGGSVIDNLTASASHEFIEAATDPYVETLGAFGSVDVDHAIWAFVPGAEDGDFCEYIPEAYQPLVGSFIVQRGWSNASAVAGHDPCVPVMPHPYVGAAPLLTENVMLTDGPNGPMITKGVKVAIGEPKTIDIALYSDVPTDDWTVEALDASVFFGAPNELALQLDKSSGHNGDTLHLTISRIRDGNFGGTEFVISTKIDGQTTSMYWGYAAN